MKDTSKAVNMGWHDLEINGSSRVAGHGVVVCHLLQSLQHPT